jgi:hypothetical protein
MRILLIFPTNSVKTTKGRYQLTWTHMECSHVDVVKTVTQRSVTEQRDKRINIEPILKANRISAAFDLAKSFHLKVGYHFP